MTVRTPLKVSRMNLSLPVPVLLGEEYGYPVLFENEQDSVHAWLDEMRVNPFTRHVVIKNQMENPKIMISTGLHGDGNLRGL
jgi:hypothetical protein